MVHGEENRMTLSETLHGIVCEVCHKRFSGRVPAQQHLLSEAHLQKVKQQAEQSTDPLWCKACSVLCNSLQQYTTHCDSPRHLHMVQQVDIIKKQQALSACRLERPETEAGDTVWQGHSSLNPLSGIGDSSDAGRIGERSLEDNIRQTGSLGSFHGNIRASRQVPSVAMSTPGEIPPGGVYFENNRGHCFVCGIELTSLQHKTQHVEGKLHKKKAMAFGSATVLGTGGTPNNVVGEGVMMCTICNVSLSGEHNVQEHFNGAKHKARKAEYDRLTALSGTSENHDAATSHVETDVHTAAQRSLTEVKEISPVFDLHGPNSMPGRTVSFPGVPYQQSAANPPNSFQHELSSAQDSASVTVSHPIQSPEALKVEWQPQKRRGVCGMCDEEFGSSEEVSRHLASAEHKQREEEINKPSCEVCQVQYSGLISAKQHLNSEKHKKRVQYNQLHRLNYAAPEITRTAENEACLLNMTDSMTSSQLSHKMSDIHDLEEAIKKAFKNSLDTNCPGSQNMPPSSRLLSQTQTLNALDERSRAAVALTQYNIPPSEAGRSDLPHAPSDSQPSVAEYVFDGSRGFCYVCKIDFTSKSHAESHLHGAKHQKAAVRWHSLNSRAQGGVSQGTFGTQGQSASSTGSQVISSTQDLPKSKEAFRFDGNRGYCFACKIDLTSESHANQHLVGKKHQSATERWILEGEACNYPLYCDVCYKPFTGQESAAQHFSSDKHKKKVALSEGASAGKRDPVTGALMIIRDGQMWYMCETCKCPLNTPEQFRLHVNSPRHNAEVEKSKKQDHSNRSSPVDAVDVTHQNLLTTTAAAAAMPGPSDLQHLGKTSSVKVTPGVYIPQPPPTHLFNFRPVKTEPGMNLTDRAESGQTASASSQTSLGISVGLKADPGNNSAFTATIGRSEHGPTPRGITGANVSNPENSAAGIGSQSVGNNSGIQQDGSVGSQSHPVHGGSRHRFNESALSELAQHLPLRQVSRGGSGNRGNRGTGQVLRMDGDYEIEDDSARMLPTSSSATHYQDQSGGNQQSESGQAEDSMSSSMAMSSVHGGQTLSHIEDERGLAASGAKSMSDNLSSVHTDPGSLMACKGLRYNSEITPDNQSRPLESSHFKGFRYACLLCKQPMNTKEDYDRHMKGLKHQMRAATVSAPDRSQEKLFKVEKYDDAFKVAYKCCKTSPRTYQVELMAKAMTSDSTVVYLPTGTGKTLAAMMTLSRMLTLNPTRPVLFLVDKVLLVLQQARYIINELGLRDTFSRPALTDEKKLEERQLKVAVLCGGLSVRDGTPLWKHDVIVTTAAFCQNLLQDAVLRWANFSLVVFDEAHHCTKNHPYNRLLLEHHLRLPQASRPKVLGLTASPAGRRTKEETLTMLEDLLKNLGGASIATIEKPIAKEQLDKYSSSARLVPVCVPMTEDEMGFHVKLLSYFIRAYVELMSCSNLQQICCSALQNMMRSKPPKADDITSFAQHLMNEPDELSEMVQLAQTARIKPNTVPLNKFENIRMHVMTVGMTLLNSEDGIDFVLDDLERLFDANLNKCFDELTEMGLPCKEISTYVKTLCDSVALRNSEKGEKGEEGSHSTMSIFQELLQTLANPEYMNWDSEDSMALVLVRERKVAHKFKDHLKATSFVREHNMRVAVVVGHGAGSGEGDGMNLRKQDKVLQGIKSHRYNIVVATSVAEEGVDIPECQLVVCLNPPTTVKAMVQMRGRARKKDSYFVVLCSSLQEKQKLEDLQRQEGHMKWAVAQLTQHDAADH